jgi:hypothetical protein
MEETLNKLANKKRLTEADKLKIDVLTREITGKGFTPKSPKCRNCHRDQIFILLNILKQNAANAEAKTLEESNKKVRMREPHGTNGLNFGNGLIINNNNVYLYVDFLKKMGLERFLIE